MSPSRPLSFRDDYKAGDDLQGLFLLFVNLGVALHHTSLRLKMMVFVSTFGDVDFARDTTITNTKC